jgi:NAD dependent epimerase/dehydratase family enzyme
LSLLSSTFNLKIFFPPMAKILITGGTGLIGTALSRVLIEKGYQVTILSRNPSKAARLPRDISQGPGSGIQFARWNIEKQTIDRDVIEQSDYIIHLAGAGIADKRWSDIVKAVVSASAIGWYGAGGEPSSGFIETDPPDKDFLGETCRLWEESIEPVTALSKRLVKIRTGIVLSTEGGALSEFKKPIKLGIAAILGNGKQIISWIHIEDLCRIYLESIRNENWKGVINAVAPQSVNNKRLTIELARKLKGRFFIPLYIPPFVLRLLLGEMSIEVLKSAKVSAQKLHEAGFQFLYPGVEAALHDLTK